MRINKTKNRVYKILEKYPETRNSDGKLTAYYWYEFEKELLDLKDGEWIAHLKNLSRLTSESKLGRIRRKIQNEEGRFWPTVESIAKKRKLNMVEWKQWSLTRKDTL